MVSVLGLTGWVDKYMCIYLYICLNKVLICGNSSSSTGTLLGPALPLRKYNIEYPLSGCNRELKEQIVE